MSAKFVLTTWEGESLSVKIDSEQPVIIGRDESCDIVVSDQMLSKAHVEISPIAGGFRLRDLDTTNGTLVNNAEVSTIRLLSGDRIVMGKSLFAVFVEVPTNLPAAVAEAEEAELVDAAQETRPATDPEARQADLIEGLKRVEGRLRDRREVLQKMSVGVQEKRGENERLSAALERIDKDFKARSSSLEKISKSVERARQSLLAQEREAERKLRGLRQQIDVAKDNLRISQKKLRDEEGKLQERIAQSGQAERDLVQANNAVTKKQLELDKILRESRLRAGAFDEEFVEA